MLVKSLKRFSVQCAFLGRVIASLAICLTLLLYSSVIFVCLICILYLFLTDSMINIGLVFLSVQLSCCSNRLTLYEIIEYNVFLIVCIVGM